MIRLSATGTAGRSVGDPLPIRSAGSLAVPRSPGRYPCGALGPGRPPASWPRFRFSPEAEARLPPLLPPLPQLLDEHVGAFPIDGDGVVLKVTCQVLRRELRVGDAAFLRIDLHRNV